jgi:beta-glucosidase
MPLNFPARRFPVLLLAMVAALGPRALSAQGPVPDSPAVEQRVDRMLAALTLEQKIDLLGGVDSMYVRAAVSAGFPRLKMSDGPVGVRTWGPSTAYAGGIALAATWDQELARRMGEAIGDDARARGVHFLLGPGVNINRAPMNGRNFEYFGEDPFLAARMAVGYIEGVQSQGVVATVKHFAANNSEFDRRNLSSDIDERTLREIYLPAFEAAVKEAQVGAVMNSYNLVNGLHATQSPLLNRRILKGDWAFDGLLMSDWDATHDAVAAANAGLDLEMPKPTFLNRATLLPAVQAGTVTVATIDDKIRRLFRTAIRFGFLDRPQADLGLPVYSQMARGVALDEARGGLVLLQNRGDLLPLDPAKVRTIAIIGPDAWPAVPGGGGSSQVSPYRATSILTGVADLVGSHVRVLYAGGLPTPEEFFNGTTFAHEGATPPLKMEVFETPDFTGPANTSLIDHAGDWRSEMWTPKAQHPRSVRWSAHYTAAKAGPYLFLAGAGGEDQYSLYVDGKKIIQQPFREGQAPASAEVTLAAGQTVTVRLDYQPYSDHLRAGFGIRAAADVISADAKAIAAEADTVLVCAGFDPTTEREGYDRTFTLPWGQDDLIEAVAAINPRTVVALTSGGGVDMRRWLDRVPAVLQLWYPGQEGGTALAEILFGQRSPEGKLPVTFDHSWEESPVHDTYYPAPHPDGAESHVKYAEGLFYGYRYYTSAGKKPLFPFGFGLTYTSFAFSKIEVAIPVDGTPTSVSFNVTNTGPRAGAEVAQLYLGDPSAKAARPLKELKGFLKVRLEPGKTQRVTIPLHPRDFAYFDAAAHAWRIDHGNFILYVGDSSENTPLKVGCPYLPFTGTDHTLLAP